MTRHAHGIESRMIYVVLLLAAGVAHGLLFLLGDRTWDDSLSFRKATLFGLSTGLTLWSCLWVLRQLPPKRSDTTVSLVLCWSLVIEVALITLQTWRGEHSHFNHAGRINGLIEASMLACITVAMVIILLITWRVWLGPHPDGMSSAMHSAVSWGMLLLSLSGMIGFAITQLGYRQLALGQSHEIWPSSGVLKFPHGAALHAVQTLVALVWLTDRFLPSHSRMFVRFAVGGHWLLLIYATYQTALGKSRFDVDVVSTSLLIALVGCILIPLLWWILHRPSVTSSP